MRAFGKIALCSFLLFSVVSSASADAGLKEQALKESTIRSLRSDGQQSYQAVLKPPAEAKYSDQIRRAVYKPQTKNNPRVPFSEISAFRVARLLGVGTVPIAVFRTHPLSTLKKRYRPRSRWKRHAKAIIADEKLGVQGALLEYVPTTKLAEKRRTLQRWMRVNAEVPAGRLLLARDWSNRLVLDFLIGNDMRQAIRSDASGKRLVLSDHTRAFGDGVSEFLADRLLAVQRFSRSLITAIAGMNKEVLVQTLRVTTNEEQTLVDRAQVDLVLKRKSALMSRVASLCEQLGTDNVLFFK